MEFHSAFFADGNDNLADIADVCGFDNPGPIVFYPPNRSLFQGEFTPSKVPESEVFFVPWTRESLKKFIVSQQELKLFLQKSASRLMNAIDEDKAKADEWLFFSDLAAFIATTFSLGAAGVSKSATAVDTTWEQVAQRNKDMVRDFIDGRASVVQTVVTSTVPSPKASDWKSWPFVIRHTLGPWNPSFWASVWTAIKEGDADIYLYGTDAIAHKVKAEIKMRTAKDEKELDAVIKRAIEQMHANFYGKRI